MVSCFISRLVILIFGTLYPAYASYKAVRTKNVREYVKWMMYWIVFALFTCAETFTDLFLSFWFPFYYEIKIITVIYLLSPATKGSSILYRRFVHPVLTKREQDIDEYIAKAKEQGYHTMLNLGSKGVTYATSLIMQTAIKSGGGLVNHLRKSYSLSDLNEERNLRRSKEESADDVDSSYGEDPRLIRRNLVQSSRRTIASPGQAGLYFPEVDLCERPEEEGYYRQITSSEEISSGYSSGDPMYYPAQRSKGDSLVRTASLGPSTRIRTRAVTRNGLPKRSTLSEGGSSWSAVESQGIQSETDHHYNFPLSHSGSFPFPFPPLQQTFHPPEYQQLFGNLTQNQLFTFINHPAYSHILSTKPFEYEGSTGASMESNSDDSKSVEVLEESSEVKSEKQSETSSAVMSNEDKILSSDVGAEAELKNEKDKTSNGNEKCENVQSKEVVEGKEKFQERSGKYNKKPAPTPPDDENSSKITLTVCDDEAEFFTPNASPNLKRKHIASEDQSTKDNDSEDKSQDLSEVPKKSNSKTKKGDFSISKKLHVPKMSFSFWHQKGGKRGSGSEVSSVSSAEIPAKSEKNDLEYFIPLKDDDDNRTDENSGKGEGKD